MASNCTKLHFPLINVVMAGNSCMGARKPRANGEERALSSDCAQLTGKTFQSGSPSACWEGIVSLVMVSCSSPAWLSGLVTMGQPGPHLALSQRRQAQAQPWVSAG